MLGSNVACGLDYLGEFMASVASGVWTQALDSRGKRT